MTDIEYIASRLSREDILCQLAEEASELAQAALKLRRVITGTNPTPMNYRDACDNLIEEIADVRAAERVVICAGTEDTSTANLAIESKMEYKTYRWAKRLRKKEYSDDKDRKHNRVQTRWRSGMAVCLRHPRLRHGFQTLRGR